jgi:hypothetical protein
MHIHRERVDRTEPWDTVYEPSRHRTIMASLPYVFLPMGLFSGLAAPVPAIGGASGFRLLVGRSHVQFHRRRRFHCGSGRSYPMGGWGVHSGDPLFPERLASAHPDARACCNCFRRGPHRSVSCVRTVFRPRIVAHARFVSRTRTVVPPPHPHTCRRAQQVAATDKSHCNICKHKDLLLQYLK